MGALMYVSFIFALLLTSLRRPSAQVHAGSSPDPPLTQIPWDLYHRSHDLLDKVRGLVGRHPDKLSIETLRAGNKGYGAEVVVVTYSAFKRKTYNNTAFRILLTFGQHGRELITTEVALRLLSILSNEHASLGIDHVLLHESLKNLVIKVVPMENLNGRKLVEAGDLCDRRNGRGVDLNRNWSVDWGKKEKDFDPYEEYPGSAPFSEPEVQIMRKLSTSFNPHIWVNVHSGMEALFMPYDHKNTTPRGVTSPVMKAILEELNYNHCKGRCLIGSGGGSVGYLAHGTATDYMYEIVKVPLAFTFEIYGDVDASTKDCFKMFNPVDTIAFEKVLNDWSAAFLKMFQITPLQLGKIRKKFPMNLDGMISMDSGVVLDGSLRGRKVGTMEGFELGMQEMRTYFRLFLLSCVLLMFMFCSRISKSKFIATKTNPTT